MAHTEIQRTENTGKFLQLIAEHGWMRPQELAAFSFEAKPFAIKYAQSICRRLLAEGLVISRTLPARNGTAFVLSKYGAEVVTGWQGRGFGSGKDWGRIKDGVWFPPASWRHDLLATGLLAHFHCLGFAVFPEHMLRREETVEKYPDGLIFNKNEAGFWLEVEHSRKSGKNMNRLVTAIYQASTTSSFFPFDSAQHFGSIKGAIIGIVRTSKDERGFRLNHLERIENALRRRLRSTTQVRLTIAWITLKGAGVGSVELQTKLVNG